MPALFFRPAGVVRVSLSPDTALRARTHELSMPDAGCDNGDIFWAY
jgi:hypothetical protein